MNATPNAETIIIELPADFALNYKAPKGGREYSVPLAIMANPAKTLAYLAQRGYTENLTNAAALSKEQKADKLKSDPKFDFDKYVTDRREGLTLAYIQGDFDERAGAPRLTREERVTREVTLLFMTAYLERKGEDQGAKFKLPDGEVLTKMMAKYAANPKNGARIEAEVARRLAVVGSDDDESDDDEGDDLLAMAAQAAANKKAKAEKAEADAKAAAKAA